MQTAWAFLVVSSKEQEDSLPTQRALVGAAAAERGWEIARTFEDSSSGMERVRPLFTEMLEALRSTPAGERPYVVIIKRQDRIGRGTIASALVAISDVRELGVEIYSCLEGFIKNDDFIEEIASAFRAGYARQENKVRGDRLRAGHARRRAEGKRWAAPYGTQLTPEKTLVAIEPHASLVRTAYEMRATGAGYERIARAIAPNAPAQPRKDGTFRRLGWHRTFIAWMLKHDAYRGLVVPEEI